MTRFKYLNYLPPPPPFPIVSLWRFCSDGCHFLPEKWPWLPWCCRQNLPCATEPVPASPIFCMDCLTSADIIKSLPDDCEIAARLRGEGSWEGSVKRGLSQELLLWGDYWAVLVSARGFRGSWSAEISPALDPGSFFTSNSGLDLDTGQFCQCLKCRRFHLFCWIEGSAPCSHAVFSPWVSKDLMT